MRSIFSIWFWRDLKYAIRCFFFHQNKWAIKCLPRDWRDKDVIFEEVLYAGIIHYVEVEKAFETVEINEPIKSELTEIYHWAKTGRHEFQKKIDNIDTGSFLTPNKENLLVSWKLMDEMEAINDKHLMWIIKNRSVLWT